MLIDLFTWWIISISWSIIFLVLIGIYLYSGSKTRRIETGKDTPSNPLRVAGHFMILWILLGLLAFYVIAVDLGSALFFALGNIAVEIIILVHITRNRSRDS